MDSAKGPDPELYRQQIEAYTQELPHYACYADALKMVLEQACRLSIPQAIVQARPKSVSSFAAKFARKHSEYADPVHEFTDLCGARVIVQTLDQIKAVRLFIERNFEVVDVEDKETLLDEDRFGYRDLHYLVKMNPERALVIGFKPSEQEEIGRRIAEVQVRTVAEHAWADILHDRMYKAPLRLSLASKRTGALLAAVMEDGDRTFDRLATEIDTMVANYSAYAGREAVKSEIAIQELILASDAGADAVQRARMGLQLAQLLGPCGDHERVVSVLEPLSAVDGPVRGEVLAELGHALCRVHRAFPRSEAYQRGQRCLEEAVRCCTSDDLTAVPDLRRRSSLHARALSRLASSWESVPHEEGKALEYYRAALRQEPGNPYHLAHLLGIEMFCHPSGTWIESMRPSIEQAIRICSEHALARTELPYALLAAGRLSLLLDDGTGALGWYARGMQHIFDGDSCVPADVLDDEIDWLKRLRRGATKPPEAHYWIEWLITLGRGFGSTAAASAAEEPTDHRVLIVAGGAGTMDAETLRKVRPCLQRALEHFHGTVVSGGTAVGIPGCVGEIAAELRRKNAKCFELVGYIPGRLPHDAPKDDRYDRFVVVGEDVQFSPGQILRTWEDLQRDGITRHGVSVLGFGGGPLSAVEYRVGLALGASVGVIIGSGGAADSILSDPVWLGVRALLALPCDMASLQAFVTWPRFLLAEELIQEMGRAFHEHYVSGNPGRLPANMRPWPELAPTYKQANFEQARHAVEILRAAGYDVRPAGGGSDAVPSFADESFRSDVERMAELEHGRWNVERLRDGWRPGPARDDVRRIHDCLKPWEQLPDGIREYDRRGVAAYPAILARAGLEIFRVK